MKWNFNHDHIDALIKLATDYKTNIRINVLKPTEHRHANLIVTRQQYFDGFKHLMKQCESIEVGDPVLAALYNKKQAKKCPCGKSSFRIHSITPEGEIFVSPCVYLHDYKSKLNLIKHDLIDIINSNEFRLFRQRHKNPSNIHGCKNCSLIDKCGGGCAANAYLHHWINTGKRSFKEQDPYCPLEYWKESGDDFPQDSGAQTDHTLVHMNYLCTWIGTIKTCLY